METVMLTHYHGDHACGAARIKEASGCNVYAPSPLCGDHKAAGQTGSGRPFPGTWGILS